MSDSYQVSQEHEARAREALGNMPQGPFYAAAVKALSDAYRQLDEHQTLADEAVGEVERIIGVLEQERARSNQLAAQKSQIEASSAELHAQVEDLGERLQSAIETRDAAYGESARWEAEYHATARERDDLEKRAEDAAGSLRVFATRTQELQAQVRSYEADIAKMRAALDEARGRVKQAGSLQADVARLRTVLDAKNAQYEQLRSERDHLREELAKYDARYRTEEEAAAALADRIRSESEERMAMSRLNFERLQERLRGLKGGGSPGDE